MKTSFVSIGGTWYHFFFTKLPFIINRNNEHIHICNFSASFNPFSQITYLCSTKSGVFHNFIPVILAQTSNIKLSATLQGKYSIKYNILSILHVIKDYDNYRWEELKVHLT